MEEVDAGSEFVALIVGQTACERVGHDFIGRKNLAVGYEDDVLEREGMVCAELKNDVVVAFRGNGWHREIDMIGLLPTILGRMNKVVIHPIVIAGSHEKECEENSPPAPEGGEKSSNEPTNKAPCPRKGSNMSLLYCLHFTQFSLLITLYSLLNSQFSLHSTLYSLHSTLYSLYSPLAALACGHGGHDDAPAFYLPYLFSSLLFSHCPLLSLLYSLHSPLYALYCLGFQD